MKTTKVANKNMEKETARVNQGIVIREGSVIKAFWDNGYDETWTLPANAWGIQQAKENFAAMVERWSE